jgi:hypothetical protein
MVDNARKGAIIRGWVVALDVRVGSVTDDHRRGEESCFFTTSSWTALVFFYANFS